MNVEIYFNMFQIKVYWLFRANIDMAKVFIYHLNIAFQIFVITCFQLLSHVF